MGWMHPLLATAPGIFGITGFNLFPLCLLQGHLHDRYGQLVSIYTRLLLTKISFHAKVRPHAASAPLRAVAGAISSSRCSVFLWHSTPSSPQALRSQMRS